VELKKSSTCCPYLGTFATIAECRRAGERHTAQRVDSITFHDHPDPQAGRKGAWDGTCYGTVDGTWRPMPVRPGQAVAHSARRAKGRPGGATGAVSAYAWLSDMAPSVGDVTHA